MEKILVERIKPYLIPIYTAVRSLISKMKPLFLPLLIHVTKFIKGFPDFVISTLILSGSGGEEAT